MMMMMAVVVLVVVVVVSVARGRQVNSTKHADWSYNSQVRSRDTERSANQTSAEATDLLCRSTRRLLSNIDAQGNSYCEAIIHSHYQTALTNICLIINY